MSEEGLQLDPDRLYGALIFPRPKIKHHYQGFLRLVIADIGLQFLLWPNLHTFYSTVTTLTQFYRRTGS